MEEGSPPLLPAPQRTTGRTNHVVSFVSTLYHKSKSTTLFCGWDIIDLGMSPKLPSKLSGHLKVLLIGTVSLRGAGRLEHDAVLPEASIIYPTVLAKTVCVAQGVLSCFACWKTERS